MLPTGLMPYACWSSLFQNTIELEGYYSNMVDKAEEVFLEGKVKKKSDKKKKKMKDAYSNEANECSVAVPNTMEDDFKLSKEGKRKGDKKDLGVSNDADTGKNDDDSVIYNHQEENSKKKKKTKKRRKLELLEDSDKSNNEIQIEEEERLCLQTDDANDLEIDREVKFSKKEKKKKRLKEDKNHSLSSQIQTLVVEEMDAAEKVEKRKRKEENRKAKDVSRAGQETLAKDLGNESTGHGNEKRDVETENNVDAAEKVEKRKRKKENKKAKDASFAGGQETLAKDLGNDKHEVEMENNVDSAEKVEKRKRKKENRKAKDIPGAGRQETLDKDLGNEKHDVESKKGKKRKSDATNSSDPNTKKKVKRVSFSSEVEVFPASDSASNRKEKKGREKKVEGNGLVRGKRFTPEEDGIIKEAVMNYIQVHDLGEEGLKMVLNCKAHAKVKNCWEDIAPALPQRPKTAIRYRAHILFERGESRTWSAEEIELLKKYYAEHGPKWKPLADELGKSRIHVKDAWRRVRLENMKRGNWSQKEYQTLYDLVNKDLRQKVYEEKKSKHGMLIDNIGWTAISDKLETRNHPTCCEKWYTQLTSPMVKKGVWANVDDYRMLEALNELDACCVEDVDWDNLVEGRPGDVCRRRWDQMYNHIGEHGCKSFVDQVEVLLKRYCPDVHEAREIWDNKPVVS